MFETAGAMAFHCDLPVGGQQVKTCSPAFRILCAYLPTNPGTAQAAALPSAAAFIRITEGGHVLFAFCSTLPDVKPKMRKTWTTGCETLSIPYSKNPKTLTFILVT